jgi:hypothetical protein
MIAAKNAYHRNDVDDAVARSVIRVLAEAYDWLIAHGPSGEHSGTGGQPVRHPEGS